MAYDGIIFDMDGVLIEPTDDEVMYESVRRAFDVLNISPTTEEVNFLLPLAEVTPESVTRVTKNHEIEAEHLWNIREQSASLKQQAMIYTGEKMLYDDVGALSEIGASKAVVSNNQNLTVRTMINYHDLVDDFDTYYGLDPSLIELTRKKPNTYYLDRAISEMNSKDPLFVGDKSTDVEAATRLGIDSAHLDRSGSSTSPATYEIRSLAELTTLAE